ncbi:pinopsin-like [Ranitomeya imitator]|uniref:pinopsin-like n=1 Tax=Ranitomeya imitator TaxID=111125 RepID=UPI0037E78D5D
MRSANMSALQSQGPFEGPQWPHLAPRSTYLIIASLMGLVVVLAFFVNGMVIVVSLKFKKLRSPLNYILVNLAVADLLVTIFGSSISFYNNIFGYFTMGKIMCEFEGFMVSLTGIVGLWSLAILAFERYIVICKPMGDFRFQQKHAIMGCAFTWIWAFTWTSPPLFGWCSYVTEGLGTSCGPNWYTGGTNNNSYIMVLFGTCFAMPLTTIIFSYSNLLFALRAVAAQQKESETTQRAEREVSRMVVAMVLAFLICWLPYAIFAMLMATNKDIVIDPSLASMPSYFSKTATVYNPVIYVFMNKQFRTCLMKLLCCGRDPFGGDDDSSSVSGRTDVTSVSEGGGSKVSPA